MHGRPFRPRRRLQRNRFRQRFQGEILFVELREQRQLRSIRLALLAQDKFLDLRLPITNSALVAPNCVS
jgi:hypothetical protein